jgi:hypothetical protein
MRECRAAIAVEPAYRVAVESWVQKGVVERDHRVKESQSV